MRNWIKVAMTNTYFSNPNSTHRPTQAPNLVPAQQFTMVKWLQNSKQLQMFLIWRITRIFKSTESFLRWVITCSFLKTVTVRAILAHLAIDWVFKTVTFTDEVKTLWTISNFSCIQQNHETELTWVWLKQGSQMKKMTTKWIQVHNYFKAKINFRSEVTM
jgi:hypothetical protein